MCDVLITGAAGFVGAHLSQDLVERGFAVRCVDLDPRDDRSDRIDVGDADRFAACLDRRRPRIVVHAAAVKSLAACERDKATALRVNLLATEVVRDYAARRRAKVVYLSSDVVFDGRTGNYGERSPPEPINWYGRTKRGSELLLGALPGAAVCRTALVIGRLGPVQQAILQRERCLPAPDSQSILPQFILDRLQRGLETRLSSQYVSNPTPLELLALCIRRVIERDAHGIFHTAGSESVSRKQLGEQVAAVTGHTPKLIVEDHAPGADALRPWNLSLDTEQTYRALDIDPEPWRLSAVLRSILGTPGTDRP